MARTQDGVKVMIMIDLVLVKKDMLHNEQDVGCEGNERMGQGLSDHHGVVCRRHMMRLIGKPCSRC